MDAHTWRKSLIFISKNATNLATSRELIEVYQWKMTFNKRIISTSSTSFETSGLKNRKCLWIISKWSSKHSTTSCGRFTTVKIWIRFNAPEKEENFWYFQDHKLLAGNIAMSLSRENSSSGQKLGQDNCVYLEKTSEFTECSMENMWKLSSNSK